MCGNVQPVPFSSTDTSAETRLDLFDSMASKFVGFFFYQGSRRGTRELYVSRLERMSLRTPTGSESTDSNRVRS